MDENLDGRLVETLKRFVPDPEEWQKILKGRPLLEAAGLDSLSLLNLITELELLFDVRFDQDSMDLALRDVHALDAYLKAAQQRSRESDR